ncbi:response regulator transcription factor [Xylophilus sp.]|uniref:response regulator transcription factor n=1 Tax=Xylophilus sp. TaxID=2653893 RepID=UPI0013BCCBEC|nr:response regulator transcription factor [Xylophilus sp.]KAF1043896.1 MAG: Transcriptional regulatory protein OmpR [Xylophilus sp.]
MTAQALVYVVEDDAAVARLVVDTLREFGFAVERFAEGGAALRRLQAAQPDVCIIDLGLPDMDGIELVRRVRLLGGAGVLILSGRDHPVDRVMGLELGGDDYVVKPFDARELVARVRSILRRRGEAGPARRRAAFAGWTLDCAANLLRAADGTEHVVGLAEAQVLRVLLERPHQILTREQLLGMRDLAPTDRSIDVRISRLRRRIEPDPAHPRIIKTVYGAGYLFAADVQWS